MATKINLGSLIKDEIKNQRKTQKEVAKYVGISNNAMSSICSGVTFPHKWTIEKICECLDIQIEFYIKRKSKVCQPPNYMISDMASRVNTKHK